MGLIPLCLSNGPELGVSSAQRIYNGPELWPSLTTSTEFAPIMAYSKISDLTGQLINGEDDT